MLANVVKDSSILQKNEPLKFYPLMLIRFFKQIASGVVKDCAVNKNVPVINDSANIASSNKVVAVTVAKKTDISSALLFPAKSLLSKKNKDGTGNDLYRSEC